MQGPGATSHSPRVLMVEEADLLIIGVISDGLRLWAICSLLPAGPGTPVCCC